MKQAIYNKKIEEGFTLIEAIIAIFILTVGIVAVLQTFPLSVQVEKSAQMATVAAQLSQEKIEEIIAKSYDDILCYGGTLPPCEESKTRVSTDPQESFYHYWRKTRIDYVDPAADLTTTTDNTGIKKIEVTISWKSPLGATEKDLKIGILISKR